jgi:hypothetical protein
MPVEIHLSNGVVVGLSHNLEWRGEIQIRYDDEKPPMLKVYAGEAWAWAEMSGIEMLGRPDRAFSLGEAARRGELEQYGKWIFAVADCTADNKPCAGCLAGGVCDGPSLKEGGEE